MINQLRYLKYSLLAAAVIILSACVHKAPSDVEVNVVAINDFHGYIQPSTYIYQDPTDPEKTITTQAGGVAAIGGLLNELRAKDPQLLFVGVGDLIGASPPVSNIWADEPSIAAMNLLRLDLSSLGNHEFDEGKKELLRQIDGGCDSPRPDKACKYYPEYGGASYPYIAANVLDSETGRPLFPPYVIKEVKGVKIAFIGAEVEDLASVVAKSSMAGIRVIDEADAINAYIPEIKKQGVKAIVAVIHQGGTSHSPFTGCKNLTGEIVDIAHRLNPEVDVLLSAHTHEGYICKLGKLSVTQGASYGHLLTHLRLRVNTETGDVDDVYAENILIDPNRFKADPALQQLQDRLVERSRDVLDRPIARIGARVITREANKAGESAMGDLVGDAQWAATRALGAQFAIMNPGGIRSEFLLSEGQEKLVFSQVSAVHPFKGTLQVLTLTGAEIKALLERQWLDDTEEGFRPLQVSASLKYQWDAERPLGNRVLLDSIRIQGKALNLSANYRITANAFLADGGDNFAVLKQAKNRQDSGIRDITALIDYLMAMDKLGTPAGKSEPAGRIQRIH